MKKVQTIFLDIPQPTETSLRTRVYAQYNEARIAPIYLGKRFITAKEFSQSSDERKDQADVIIGHISYGFHDKLSGNRPYRYATMLRDPIARCLALYTHLKNKPENYSFSLQELLNTQAARQFSNRQASIISGSDSLDFPKKSTELLKRALKNYENSFAFVGLHERPKESLLLAHHQLGWKIQPYETGDATKQYPVNYADELKNDKKAMELLTELNQTDALLYEYVETRMMDLLNDYYPDLQDRLSQFEKSLCEHENRHQGVGNLGIFNKSRIVGWAKMLNTDNPATVCIIINDKLKYVVNAILKRDDLLNRYYTGKCGFEINLPKNRPLKKGDKISAHILNANNTPLNNSPRFY